MNRISSEIMQHCLNIPGRSSEVKGMEISVLERQRFAQKWQQQQLNVQQYENYLNESSIQSLLPVQEIFQGLTMGCGPSLIPPGPSLYGLLGQSIQTDQEFGMSRGEFAVESSGIQPVRQVNDAGYGVNFAISRTTSCPPLVAAAMEVAGGEGRQAFTVDQKLSGATGRESFKKRKAEKRLLPPKIMYQGEAEEKRVAKKNEGCAEEEESKITEQNSNNRGNTCQSNHKERCGNNGKKIREASACTSKDNTKAPEVQKPDYIHVRARRGQATDSHSLAERLRREKISERMKYLQDLVPGCNKITGKAGMLDEIINYVQSLQKQVEFLSMKLAAVNPRLDCDIDELITEQVFAACSGISADMTNLNYLHHSNIQQFDLVHGSELSMNSTDLGIRRTISAPVSVPETFLEHSCFSQIPSSLAWDVDLQNIYNMELEQGRSALSQLQTFTGTIEATNLKMEM